MSETASLSINSLRDLLSGTEPDWHSILECAEALLEQDGDAQDLTIASVVAALSCLNLCLWRKAHSYNKRALELDPSSQEAAELFSTLAAKASSMADAAYYLKIAGTLDPSPVKWFCDFASAHIPDAGKAFSMMEDDSLMKRGVALLATGDYVAAEECFRGHVAFHPTSVDGHLAIAVCMMSMEQYLSAQSGLRAAMHVLPDSGALAMTLGQALYSTGDYEAGRVVHDWAVRVDSSFSCRAHAFLDRLSNPLEDAGVLEKSYQNLVSASLADTGRDDAISLYSRGSGRITIGYVVSRRTVTLDDLGLAAVIAAHNPVRWRVIGFGEGALSEIRNGLFQHCFSVWHNISDMDRFTLSRLVQGEEIDVLVDTSGLALPRQFEAFIPRMAPLQVSWGGLPWNPGSDVFDAVVLDDHIRAAPALDEQKLVSLHGGALCTGLPPDDAPLSDRACDGEFLIGFPLYFRELNYYSVALAAACLLRIPESKIVLIDRDFSFGETVGRLLTMFGTFGVAHRIDLIQVDDEAALACECNLILSPLGPRSAVHAVSALWAGVPVLALAGEGRHMRGVSSFLTMVGLGEACVGATPDNVAELAAEWASDRGRLVSFRDTIRDRLRQAPPFDFKARCRSLEGIYDNLLAKFGDPVDC
ncbi:hypothetical protein HEQ63_04995 [Haematospirillum jordaniae]|uniref:glycosyltransferase family 41 protein n=1 Tax=Haematospirillum jordaniae TaxID=1549855 RepID=UPI001432D043|nr:glycosyltransferase family 41 protein [Haematospirillum jordaniae]NKD85538.1 hypothetical protein [Haematospirillum jordaniae]